MPDATSNGSVKDRVVQFFLPKLEKKDATPELSSFVFLAAQLALVLGVMHVFNVEEATGFLRISPLIFIGFILHSWIPVRFRLPFFFLLSMVALFVTLGSIHAIMLLTIGMGLILICHLPVPFLLRVALLLASGLGLVAIRAEWISVRFTALPVLVVPILGAIFMFRLIIYMYDLRHERKPASIWERLSYFFMFPNFFFLLFPVIDYQTFKRTYYNQDATTIYQKGISWVFKGVTQLLFYRIVYHFILPSPAEIADLGGVVQYMIATYLLYLRISGQFHLIIGLLCLFGFNLPETHNLYFLASSLSDYWRRINIYWKDFMMKIFYYPAFMRLRKFGTMTGLVISTIIVFIVTWLLHSYQWFWLQGSFPLTATDALFWGILGGLVVFSSVKEATKGRKRDLGEKTWSLAESVRHAAQVVGVFVLFSLLWTMWSSASVDEFLSLMKIAGSSSLLSWLAVLGGLLGLILIGVTFQYLNSRGIANHVFVENTSSYRSKISLVVGSLLLLVIGQPSAQELLDDEASAFLASVQYERLNQQDQSLQERGYYEELLNVRSFTSALRQTSRPKDWSQLNLFMQSTNDLYEKVMIPGSAVVHKGELVVINSWGMRDKEYEKEKLPNTKRLALLGASHVMGAGVEQDKIFDSLLENMLNEYSATEGTKFEVLNFAVPAYSLLQQNIVAEEKALAFRLDALLYIAHRGEIRRSTKKIVTLIKEGNTLKYEYLNDIIQQAGVDSTMQRGEIERKISPYMIEVVKWSYRKIAETARANNVVPVWVHMPLLGPENSSDNIIEDAMLMAKEAGFAIIDLDGVYVESGFPADELYVAPWDYHPGPIAHQLVAERLFEEIKKLDNQLGMGLTAGSQITDINQSNETVLKTD